MKLCAICGALCSPTAPHCPLCGEASFAVAVAPPKPAPAPSFEPEPMVEAPKSRRGR